MRKPPKPPVVKYEKAENTDAALVENVFDYLLELFFQNIDGTKD